MKKRSLLIYSAFVMFALSIFTPALIKATPGAWSSSGSTIYYTEGFVGIGTSAAIKTGMPLQVSSDYYTSIGLTSHHDIGNPTYVAYRSRGTKDSPTAVANGDFVGSILGLAYDGTQYKNSAGVRFSVDGTVGTNDIPTKITFLTNTDGSADFSEKMRITNSGNVGINNQNPQYKLTVNGSVCLGACN
jgi:hypothetical protein